MNTQLVPRSAIRLGRRGSEGLSRWHWAEDEADRTRVVKVAVLDTEAGRVARTFGLDGRDMALLEERVGVTAQQWNSVNRTGSVDFADGARWELGQGGCGCGSPLKRFDPLRFEGGLHVAP